MKNKTVQNYYDFLVKIDHDFPVPLSYKTDLKDYAHKIYDLANVECIFDGDSIIAMVAGYIDNCINNCAYISLVGVLKEYRGTGKASGLIMKFIKKCSDKGILKINLYTDKSNISAIKMYKKIGFDEGKDQNEPRPNDVHLFYDVK